RETAAGRIELQLPRLAFLHRAAFTIGWRSFRCAPHSRRVRSQTRIRVARPRASANGRSAHRAVRAADYTTWRFQRASRTRVAPHGTIFQRDSVSWSRHRSELFGRHTARINH